MDYSKQERIDDLLDAREALEQAIALIRGAVSDTEEELRASAYILPHLESWIEGEDTSIEALIAALEAESEEEGS